MPLENLEACEQKVYSQNGEDGVIQAIFAAIGVTNRYFVEFGCEDGSECNTANLLDQGWTGLWMDAANESSDPRMTIRQEIVHAKNIDCLLRQYGVPARFDLLSIDIDGNDFWVWKEISHRARLVVIEYNAHFPPPACCAIPYDPEFCWQGNSHFGASLMALNRLAELKGYALVHCERAGVNAFFVAQEELPGGFVPPPAESLYRRPNYFYKGLGHPRDDTRQMIDPFDDRTSGSSTSLA
jgi:hypothetical protein